jgi:hypothetical protein
VLLGSKPVVTTVLVNAVIISILLYRAAIRPAFDMDTTGLVLKAIYFVFLVSMFARATRLKRRVAEMMVAAANRTGLTRVYGKMGKPAPGH